MFSPFLTRRTKSKFVISKEGNVAETLYKFIWPEDVPVQYGGLSRPSNVLNGSPKSAFEFTVKGGEKVNIQIEDIEAGATISWDIVVGGWELEYSAEFVPIAEAATPLLWRNREGLQPMKRQFTARLRPEKQEKWRPPGVGRGRGRGREDSSKAKGIVQGLDDGAARNTGGGQGKESHENKKNIWLTKNSSLPSREQNRSL
ncbi:unnamed protein product [Fraxinus pennsylvanica]|uniref:Uncharacterized protein n=1 Tax=Fraxinus pennsylvanica TaxID=56036 RepID=A0AAD1ZXM2_9LAMI|nr:unnamed protein product [Fraxinus pennsylvanica]